MNRYFIFSFLCSILFASQVHPMEGMISKQTALSQALSIVSKSKINQAVKNGIYATFQECLDKIKQDPIPASMMSSCITALMTACAQAERVQKNSAEGHELMEIVISGTGPISPKELVPERYLPVLTKMATNLERILEIKETKLKNAPGFFRKNLPIFLILFVFLGTIAGWTNIGINAAKTTPQNPNNNGTHF